MTKEEQLINGEQWRWVPGYVGLYEVSDRGRVRLKDRINGLDLLMGGRYLKPYRVRDEALCLDLHKEGGRVKKYVHQLVIAAFQGPRPHGLEVCHNDGNYSNNWMYNLRYDSHKNNQKDMIKHGTYSPPPIRFGSGNSRSVINEDIATKIRELHSSGHRQCEIAELLKVSRRVVSLVVRRVTWKHI